MSVQITDPESVIELIKLHRIALEKRWPFGGTIYQKYGDGASTGRTVSPRLMKHLIGADLVEPDGLRWSGGSWVYRLSPLGERLVNTPELSEGKANLNP